MHLTTYLAMLWHSVTYRNHVVCNVSKLWYLHGTKDCKVNVASGKKKTLSKRSCRESWGMCVPFAVTQNIKQHRLVEKSNSPTDHSKGLITWEVWAAWYNSHCFFACKKIQVHHSIILILWNQVGTCSHLKLGVALISSTHKVSSHLR